MAAMNEDEMRQAIVAWASLDRAHALLRMIAASEHVGWESDLGLALRFVCDDIDRAAPRKPSHYGPEGTAAHASASRLFRRHAVAYRNELCAIERLLQGVRGSAIVACGVSRAKRQRSADAGKTYEEHKAQAKRRKSGPGRAI